MEWIVPLVLAAGLLAPLLHRLLGPRTGAWLAIVPAGVAIHAAWLQPAIARGEAHVHRSAWVPSLGLDWAFRVDGLGNLFVLLIAGIGALVVLHASAYLRGHEKLPRFFAFLFVFMGAMLGIATADDLFLLFVFWELTTVSSFLLIGFEQEREASRKAAVQSLLVTGAGGLMMLAGFVLLSQAAGTTSISAIAERGAELRAHPAHAWILALVLLGAFTKSAQFPFHFWLPAAMQAPTPVSAYLHSSTMVKAGVFLLARLSPSLGGSEAWLITLTGVGALSMLGGAILALGQDDLKRLLAYSTVSVLGLLTLLLGLGTPVAARAFAVTLLAHALYKGTLFLVAGNVDHEAGTRSLRALGGLRGAMPWTAAAAIVAGISMAGAPPLFGFLAKETAYEAALEAPRFAFLFGPAVFATGVCLVYAALRVGFEPFLGERRSTPQPPHDPGMAMRLGPSLLAATGLLAGILVGPAERMLIAPAAAAILQEQVPTGLALWHGFTPILALSACTVLLGFALFRMRPRVLEAAGWLAGAVRIGPGRAWQAGWDGLLALAALQTRVLQNGSLRRYMGVTLAAAFAAAAWGLWGSGLSALRPSPPATPIGVASVLLVVGGSLSMLLARSPLAAVASLGAVGFGVSLLFLVYSAPDLALTQLVVEVLTVVLLVFVLPRLPRAARGRRWPGFATVALATVGGAAMAVLTLLAAQVRRVEPISSFFDEQSLPAAHGRNVVNVILVDFRALDTLGEITVLAVAALGILALLRRGRRADAPEVNS